MSKKIEKYYITTTLPYVNADPHIGFAAEIIRADVLARYQRSLGNEVFFNTGTDEHGLKICRKADEECLEKQKYVDKYAAQFDRLKSTLNLSYNCFTRTTGEKHKKTAQEFWKKCDANGDIYKKNYKVKYCVGCELEKTDSELVDGKCPEHPNAEIELIEEENYFFRWSKYQKKLLKLYENNSDFIVPKNRQKEIENFVSTGLNDFSISRLKEKMPWGVSVPGDNEHVMYVWFDALVNYISCLGWPDDEKKFNDFWPGVQVAGKDNLRQQTAMWQAMLISAGLPTSKQILIFGFITSDGQKMSKSIGNVISPLELVEKYGTDATRYYLLAELKPFEDSDFTFEKFEIKFNADLANGLGNLVSRVSNMLEKNDINVDLKLNSDQELIKKFRDNLEKYKFNESIDVLWKKIRESDEFLSKKTPWKLKDVDEVKKILEPIAQNILNIGELLKVILPKTGEKIVKQFSEKEIKKEESLFPRI